jgi:hypothetical protein
MILVESATPLLLPLVQRLRGVPETNAARAQTGRDIAQMADDAAHAQRIAERLYTHCEWWPTPRQIADAAAVTRQAGQPDPFACSRCYDTGLWMELIPCEDRPGWFHKKPGTWPEYCGCEAGVKRKLEVERLKAAREQKARLQ